MSNQKWEPVENIDFSRRKAQDWANIYGVELITKPYDDRLWSEYEWAYFFIMSDYRTISNDFEKLDQMEMRALELRRDVFLGADFGEKEILKSKYIETEWCRKRLTGI